VLVDSYREFKMKKIKAFTLAETLIVICVIGFLAVIMLSSLTGSSPDKMKILFKKAYQITERTVGELVNDENFYAYDPENIGFRNVEAVQWPGTNEWYGSDNNAETAKRAAKFCRLFEKKLNVIESTGTSTSCGHFTTSDGIVYTIEATDFTQATPEATVFVNVDGGENGDNCVRSIGNTPLAGISNCGAGQKPDIFRIFVNFDGRVRVDAKANGKETIEAGFLKAHDIKKTQEEE